MFETRVYFISFPVQPGGEMGMAMDGSGHPGAFGHMHHHPHHGQHPHDGGYIIPPMESPASAGMMQHDHHMQQVSFSAPSPSFGISFLCSG